MMTEEFAGGAAAPAETVSTPDVPSNTPEPILESTPRGAIDRAFASLGDDLASDKPEPSVKEQVDALAPADGDRARNADGTFAAKDPNAAPAEPAKADIPDAAAVDAPKADALPGDAPARFSPDAKAVWATAPEPVKAEVLRMEREMTAGLEKYREDAAAFEGIRQFDQLAKQNGTDLPSAMERYVAFEVGLNNDPVAGFISICADKGLNPREIAAKVMGQELPPAERQTVQSERVINELRNEIAQLRNGVTTIQTGSVSQTINSFVSSLPAADQPLFDELGTSIAALINQGHDLPSAFATAKEAERTRVQRLATSFGFTPAPAAPAVPPAPDLTAQTLKGQLSVTGAPSSGSNPSNRKPPSSPRDALDRAFDTVGVT
jgi:hypothetical protein